MKPWLRQDTQDWISCLEHRIEDIGYYLKNCFEWCDENEICSDKILFTCSVMTIVWVCHMRDESISQQELFEILGIEDWDKVDDSIFSFNPNYEHMDLPEILQSVVDSFI